MKFSIIVPCYNEAKNIPLILQRFAACIDSNDIEVVLVNNGSVDDSQAVLDKLLPNYAFAKTVLVPVNQGYGYGILSGLKQAAGEFVGWTHADMQTDPRDVITACNLIRVREYDKNLYVKGCRKKRSFFDQFFTIGMSCFETMYLKTCLWDINAQPNIFHKNFFESWHNPPHDFSLDLYVLYMARQKNLEIIRFPVLFPERIHGTSSWNTGMKSKIKFIKRTLSFSTKLKRELKHDLRSP